MAEALLLWLAAYISHAGAPARTAMFFVTAFKALKAQRAIQAVQGRAAMNYATISFILYNVPIFLSRNSWGPWPRNRGPNCVHGSNCAKNPTKIKESGREF